jgi:hypothetical protein
MFINCSTCFGQHTAHYQELKNCNCSLCFYICFWLPASAMAKPSQRPATTNVCNTRGCNCSFELLMISGVSPETYWAINKHGNNKFYYTVATCWFFLWETFRYIVICYIATTSVAFSSVLKRKSLFMTRISKIKLILPREEPGTRLKTRDSNFWEIKNHKTR